MSTCHSQTTPREQAAELTYFDTPRQPAPSTGSSSTSTILQPQQPPQQGPRAPGVPSTSPGPDAPVSFRYLLLDSRSLEQLAAGLVSHPPGPEEDAQGDSPSTADLMGDLLGLCCHGSRGLHAELVRGLLALGAATAGHTTAAKARALLFLPAPAAAVVTPCGVSFPCSCLPPSWRGWRPRRSRP